MWIPHFGYILWLKQGENIDSEKSTKDNSERIFKVQIFLEDLGRRDLKSSAFSLKDNVQKLQTEVVRENRQDNKIETPFLYERNEKGRLSNIKCAVLAKSKEEAVAYAYNSLSHLFSLITFLDGAPLSIWAISVGDEKYKLGFEAKPQNAIPSEFVFPMGMIFGKRFRSILSLYREGRVSISPFYRFFCFYKILEGVFERRVLLEEGDSYLKIHAKNHPELKRPKRKITAELLTLAMVKPQYVSELKDKTFAQFWEWIRTKHRHLIAHTFPKEYTESEWLDLDNFNLYVEFTSVGNITDLVVRQIIEDELAFWDRLAKLNIVDLDSEWQ